MAYLLSKIAAGLFGVWGVFVVSGANVGFYDPQPIPSPSTANTVYEGLEQPPEALQQPVEATTTTITTIAGCDDVVSLAASLGWPASELDTLRRVANAESRCMPWAHNASDPNGGSYGIMQINGFWCIPNTYWPTGWLQAHGLASSCDDLYSATANLQAALAIWHNSGWQAWSTY
jgi:hypothetical protein